MDALPHKMKAFHSALIIKFFKFGCKVQQRLVSFLEVKLADAILMNDTNSEDELAKVFIVGCREDIEE
jgi:hypothetical protein